MANLDELDPTLDPVVRAAMITQPTDSEEEKSAKKLDGDPAEDPAEEKKEEVVVPDPEKKEEKQEETPKEKTPEPKTEKPKAEEVKQKEGEELEDPPKTRKEKRAERKAFLESVRRNQEEKAIKREERYQADPNYKPLEFENKDYDHKELEEDRSKYGQNEFIKGAKTAAETEKYYAEQDKFWQATEYESKLLEKDPEFAFLDESNPENFDADKTADLNESYLELVGYDPKTSTVRRTDISFEKYVRHEVEKMKRWAEDIQEETEKNLVAQKSASGIRPGGSPKKSMGKLNPGDISRMSDEDYEKNRDEINRQILAAL